MLNIIYKNVKYFIEFDFANVPALIYLFIP